MGSGVSSHASKERKRKQKAVLSLVESADSSSSSSPSSDNSSYPPLPPVSPSFSPASSAPSCKRPSQSSHIQSLSSNNKTKYNDDHDPPHPCRLLNIKHPITSTSLDKSLDLSSSYGPHETSITNNNISRIRWSDFIRQAKKTQSSVVNESGIVRSSTSSSDEGVDVISMSETSSNELEIIASTSDSSDLDESTLESDDSISCDEISEEFIDDDDPAWVPIYVGTSVCIDNTKYGIIKYVCQRLGMKIVEQWEDWNLCWFDNIVPVDVCKNMRSFQRINHFPGMLEVCHKGLMARHLNRMKKQYPNEYNFHAPSWCFPGDITLFKVHCRKPENRGRCYIIKPPASSQGRGIRLFRKPSQVADYDDGAVVSEYIPNPLTIDGFKFDLRLYVLVTQCDPWSIFIFRDGLARFATQKYKPPHSSNIEDTFTHLTNYSLNKHSKTFDGNISDNAGSKRSAHAVFTSLKAKRGVDIDALWKKIDDIVIKLLISADSTVGHQYRSSFSRHVNHSASFEILGFDILIDSDLQPWLLEVNHSCSFNTDSDLDKKIKLAVIRDALLLVQISADDKIRSKRLERSKTLKKSGATKDSMLLLKEATRRINNSFPRLSSTPEKSSFKNMQNQNEDEKFVGNGFRKIYPLKDNYSDYEKFLSNTPSLWKPAARASRDGGW